jgi:diguanylate cyclase (GGDEF)-like protein
MFVDLDRFKTINDSLGHEAGDSLLKEVAVRLTALTSASTLAARLGGDEFVILMLGASDQAAISAFAHRALTLLAIPYQIGQHELRITASIGVSCSAAGSRSDSMLMKQADIAMYEAKDRGKNAVAFYTDSLNRHSLERLALETSLRHALARHELVVHYQPKIDCKTGAMSGAEALIRWNHPDLGLVPPSDFIALAEETGLIVPIGRWVLECVCLQIAEWQQAGLQPVRVAVNLSARQFEQDDLLNDIASIIESAGIDPALLECELTESMLMGDVDQACTVLSGLRRLGVHVSVDDFGTGYSSLANLKQFPVGTLKIDRAFVRDLSSRGEDKAIASAIIAMGHSLGMTVVAEGVENEEQAAFLRTEGCDAIQGFLYSKAVPAVEFEGFFAARRSLSKDALQESAVGV